MSFILDALKKSENDRQRQSGPGLFEVKVAAPKARWPAWAFALAGLLAINIGVVVWLVLRQPSQASTQIPASAPPAAMAPAALPAPEASPPVTAPPPAAQTVAAEPTEAGASEANPEDYEPAAEPPASVPGPAAEPPGHVTRATAEGLPTYEEMAGRPGLPELRLDLHVYAAQAKDRFILLNMHRLREGDSLPEGVRVEEITPGGAILSFQGSKFVFDRQ